MGEIARDQLYKGDTVYIERRLQTAKWAVNNNQPRYITQIIASTVLRLSPPKHNNQRTNMMPQTMYESRQVKLMSRTPQKNKWDDLPFESKGIHIELVFHLY